MPTDIAPAHRQRIAGATADLIAAQNEVERAMLELSKDTPRSEKTLISEVLKVAFEKLAAARAKLETLTLDA